MFSFLVNAEGGLTTAGYAVCIAAGIVLFAAALLFAGKVSEKKKMGTKQLVFCAMALALAFITSYIKIFNMPWGGSVTLCSMLFIVLVGNWYGPKRVELPSENPSMGTSPGADGYCGSLALPVPVTLGKPSRPRIW